MASAMFVRSAIVEDTLIDGLETGFDGTFLLQSFGAVFKHVVLRGKIGEIMFEPHAFPLEGDTPAQLAFEQANEEYYRHVDWALDIREAEFRSCDIRRIPARLIRRDPESQVVVTRKKALEGSWRELDLEETYWREAIYMFLQREDEDVVLVAAKQHRNYRAHVVGLQRLRDAGVAEPE
jgi:hypothetical protein